MKSFFTFAIIALQFHAFAQVDHSTIIFSLVTTYPIEYSHDNLTDGRTPNPELQLAAINNTLQSHNSGQQPYNKIMDSTYDYSMGNLYAKTIYGYDANNKITSYKYQTWNGAAWANSTLTSVIFKDNHIKSYIDQNWNGNTWINSTMTTFSSDVNNNDTAYLFQVWNENTWTNVQHNSYAYNSNNKLTKSLYQFWDNNTWANGSRRLYTYDTNSNQTSSLLQIWNNGIWLDNYADSTTYDTNNRSVTYLSKTWNGSLWVNSELWLYEHNTVGEVNYILHKQWIGNNWMNSLLDSITYDTINNVTKYLRLSWNGSAWENYYLVTDEYTYDANNFQLSYTRNYWNNTDITRTYSTYYYFHLLETTSIPDVKETGIAIFPNPSKGKITLSSEKAIDRIEIYNSTGSRVCSDSRFKPQSSHEIDLSGFSKGIYFIKTYNGTRSNTKKLIIQ